VEPYRQERKGGRFQEREHAWGEKKWKGGIKSFVSKPLRKKKTLAGVGLG